MNRENLQREIARLDQEINALISSAEIPKYDARPFPTGTWIITILCFAWYLFGSAIPGAASYYHETAYWAFIGSIVLGIVAILSTISWFFRRRGFQGESNSYMKASLKARELQERRRDLQAELRAITKE